MSNAAWRRTGQRRQERATRAIEANSSLGNDPVKLAKEIGCSIPRAKDCIDSYQSWLVFLLHRRSVKELLKHGMEVHNLKGDWRTQIYFVIDANPSITVDQLQRQFGFSESKTLWVYQTFFDNHKVTFPGEKLYLQEKPHAYRKAIRTDRKRSRDGSPNHPGTTRPLA